MISVRIPPVITMDDRTQRAGDCSYGNRSKVQSDNVKNLGLRDDILFLPLIAITCTTKFSLRSRSDQTIKSMVRPSSRTRGKAVLSTFFKPKTTEEPADVLVANGAVAYHVGLMLNCA